MQEILNREVGILAPPGGARTAGKQVNNGNLNHSAKGGNKVIYTLRRLKRDRPDLAERVIRSELSANRAAIEAGFRAKTITVPGDSAEKAIRVLLKHFARKQLLKAFTRSEAGAMGARGNKA